MLVAAPYTKNQLDSLAAAVELVWLDELTEAELDGVLPDIDCLFVQFWPKALDARRLSRMARLAFIQSGLAGVNHIPFAHIPSHVTVSSNAGGYSDEVGEFAWGLLLAGAKKITRFSRTTTENTSKSPLELAKGVVVLRGRTLGVLGYGGIGASVARIGLAFGMKVKALTREGRTKVEGSEGDIEYLSGPSGLQTILRDSDAIVLALPLTKETKGMVGAEELELMKKDAVLVNVARGEIVDQRAVYERLVRNPNFVYATDVWWTKDGKEEYPPALPFLDLTNFIGTPHVSGPSAVGTGGPLRNSVENILRFVDGKPLRGVVRREEYT